MNSPKPDLNMEKSGFDGWDVIYGEMLFISGLNSFSILFLNVITPEFKVNF